MKQWKKILVSAMFIILALETTASAADYTVTANDSLYKISRLFKVSIKTLQADNYLGSDEIMTGQKLTVPAIEYTVKTNDTIQKIASTYGVTAYSIRNANHVTDATLEPGDKLMIPGIKPYSGSSTIIPYTKAEVQLLARLIEAEAAGESYRTKVAVGGVVVNRVQSKEWAPTIKEVIYQKYGEYYQFTPVKNGMINNPASFLSVRAAWAALYGSDPSKGAIYYFDDSSRNEWLRAKPRTTVIGPMIFAK